MLQITLNAKTALLRERRLMEVAAELRETGVELERLRTIDPLIGVLNPRAFFERLEAAVRRSLRYNHYLTVLMIDHDYFKDSNGRDGHATGDRVLVETGCCIVQNFWGADVVGRNDGEELEMFLPETIPSNGQSVAEKLRAAIEGLLIEPDSGRARSTAPMRTTISIGVASLPDVSITGEQDLIRRADEALCEAKHEGRNRARVAALTAPPR
jgi:diguanylate cyclase (GGDEF)-like protein